MFVDSSGDLTHFKVHINRAGSTTDDGVTGFDGWALTIIDDVVNERVIFRGDNFNTHVPRSGYCISTNDSGNITFGSDGITIKGSAESFTDGDAATQRLCDASAS